MKAARSDRCRAVMAGACPFYKARKAADAARVLVVNHALLISDATMESRVLPDYRYLVIDEAHHLEEATTSGLSFRLDAATLRRRLADLGGAEARAARQPAGQRGRLRARKRSQAPERLRREHQRRHRRDGSPHQPPVLSASRAAGRSQHPAQSIIWFRCAWSSRCARARVSRNVQAAWNTLQSVLRSPRRSDAPPRHRPDPA